MKNGLLILTLLGLIIVLTGPALAEDNDDGMSMDHRIDLGYRGVKETGNMSRAAEYKDMQSGPVFGLDFNGHNDSVHVLIDGQYTTNNDYNADIHVDVPGTFKLNLATERLWHNLDHIPYDQTQPGSRQDGYTQLDPDNDPSTPPVDDKLRVIFEDQNPTDDYGIRVERDTAEAIFNMGSYPSHVALKYWRWEKKGQKQLRFAEEGHDLTPGVPGFSCNACHMQSKTREIDRVTEEATGMIDAHVGFFDISFEQLFRVFTVKDPIPEDNFDGHLYGPSGGADFQHSEDPESKLTQSTITARTALTGGVIVDGAYTYGRRENKSTLAAKPLGVDGVYAVSEYDKIAGNISWTPVASVMANFRYRLLDLETNNSDTLTVDYNVPDKTYPVRENMDFRRIEYSGTIAWRPSYALTIKGDYDHEIVTRSNTGGPMAHHGSTAALPPNGTGQTDLVWELPQEEVLDTLRLSLTSRPLGNSNLKLKAWYRYATSSDPAYGTSYDNRHELFASAHYAPRKANWGLSLTAKGQRDQNNEHPHSVWDVDADPVLPPPATIETAEYHLSDREREQQSYNFGAWYTPKQNFSAGLNYGYARTKTIQDVLFGGSDLLSLTPGFYNFDAESEYLQDSHSCSLYTTLQLSESIAFRLDGYITVSSSEFMPDDFYYLYGVTPPVDTSPNATANLIASTEGVNEVSRLDFVQQGLSCGLDWQPAAQWNVGVLYTIDDYRASNSDLFDGTAQTGTISLSRLW